MSLFDKTDYFEIGKSASSESLTRTFEGASSGKQKKLIEGALKAFRQGRPENIQAILPSTNISLGLFILEQLLKISEDRTADLESAFKATPQGVRKSILDAALFYAVYYNSPEANDANVTALLEAGADANAARDGFPGSLLAFAVNRSRPASVAQLLIDHGANAEEALIRAYAKGFPLGDIKTLQAYGSKHATVAIPVPPAVIKATDEQPSLLELQQEVRELRKAMELLPERIAAAITAANDAKAEKPAKGILTARNAKPN